MKSKLKYKLTTFYSSGKVMNVVFEKELLKHEQFIYSLINCKGYWFSNSLEGFKIEIIKSKN